MVKIKYQREVVEQKPLEEKDPEQSKKYVSSDNEPLVATQR